MQKKRAYTHKGFTMLNEIHKNLGMLLKANVEINEAFKIAINEVCNG